MYEEGWRKGLEQDKKMQPGINDMNAKLNMPPVFTFLEAIGQYTAYTDAFNDYIEGLLLQ